MMTKEKLNKILEKHMHWLREDCVGWETMRADLSGAELRGVDLSGADLRRAILRGANLNKANLREANLSRAYLRGANLYETILCDADLRRADLGEVDLMSADLRRADLSRACLCFARLCEADLCFASLYKADLFGADLYKADLYKADLNELYLNGANLRVAKNVPFIPSICPETGSFIGWKKDGSGRLIIKLLIPEDAKRTSSTSRKCRCDKAEVLAIENLDGTPSDRTETYSSHDEEFIYRVGEIVTPKEDFYDDRFRECASGIHFFISRQEAVEY